MMRLFKEVMALNNVQLAHCLWPPNTIGNNSLAIFCDASRWVFGTCTYIKWNLNDGKFGVQFVAAKSRVAPSKELSIPRLELQAAVIGSWLGSTILEELQRVIEKKEKVAQNEKERESEGNCIYREMPRRRCLSKWLYRVLNYKKFRIEGTTRRGD